MKKEMRFDHGAQGFDRETFRKRPRKPRPKEPEVYYMQQGQGEKVHGRRG